MWDFLKTYLVTFGVFLALEGAWLVLIANKFYQKEIGFLLSESPKLVPTLIFSLIFVGGLVFFVVNPAMVKESWKFAFLAGVFLGVFAYGTYDLTNYATLEAWPLKVVLVDLLWGATLGGAASTISYLILNIK